MGFRSAPGVEGSHPDDGDPARGRESDRRAGTEAPDAHQPDALKRVIKMVVRNVRELYLAQPALPAKDIIDPAAWEKSAVAEIDQATDFHGAYAHAGYQTMLALAVMTLVMSETPPRTAEEATRRANEAVAARVKSITARFTTS